jgi:hypothetical protein
MHKLATAVSLAMGVTLSASALAYDLTIDGVVTKTGLTDIQISPSSTGVVITTTGGTSGGGDTGGGDTGGGDTGGGDTGGGDTGGGDTGGGDTGSGDTGGGSTVCGAVPDTIDVADGIDWAQPGTQTRIALAKKIKSMPFTATTSAGYLGQISIASTTGNSGVKRQVWVSECPGTAYTAANTACAKTGTSSTVIYFEQGTKYTGTFCQLTPNKDYYINVKNVDCKSTSCDVYRNIYTNGKP